MPRREYVIRIFVSSPSDLAEERQLLEELVRELNATWSRELGLRFELVRWETDVLPGAASEPQEVIEAAIGDDYDAFVGLLWKRFGTPTRGYASGTAQEFERALERSRVDPSLRLMFYFNESPMSPSDVDLDGLAKIRAFRDRLGERGVLWFPFKERSEFMQLLRLHLSKLAQEWRARLNEDPPTSVRTAEAPAVAPDSQNPEDEVEAQDDEGLIDLAESIQADLATMNATVERMSQAITDVGGQMETGAAALDALRRESDQVDPARIKRTINRTAEDVETFAKRIDAEVPIFASVYERMVQSVARAAVIQLDLGNAEDPVAAAASAAANLAQNLRGAKEGAVGMRKATAAWPRMTTVMNRARRRAVAALDKLISEYERAIDVTDVVVGSLRGRL
jgi:Domain of unknown function (DUF4062)